MIKNYPMSRLPLSGAFNARDLGGHPTKDNKVTSFNRFKRSDYPSSINSNDVIKLKEHNVRVVIDLRTEFETNKDAHSFSGIDFIEIHKIPLFDEFGKYRKNNENEDPLYEMYISILDYEKENLSKVFNTMLDHPNTCILFHCTAGKDRTGIIAMLLLGLANVYDNDIVSNYEVSHSFTKDREDLLKLGNEIPSAYFESNSMTMRKTLAYLNNKYGGFRQFFEELGFDSDRQEKIVEGFVSF